jgi:transcriptional regulator with XRE-family HTH domain
MKGIVEFQKKRGVFALRAEPSSESAPSDSSIVTKATIRAAEKLNLKNKDLARIIGVSEPTVSRMKRGEYPLDPTQKPFELALLFIRLYRSLDALVGDDGVAAAWLANQNTALNGAPIKLIHKVDGLINVIQYLDARRAVV